MMTRRSSRFKKSIELESNNNPIKDTSSESSKRKSNVLSKPQKKSKTVSNVTLNRNIACNSTIDLTLESTSDRKSQIESNHTPNKKKPLNPEKHLDNKSNDSIYSEVLACFSASQYVLSKNYANVIRRLNLTFPAKCTQSLIKCCNGHHKNHDIAMSSNGTTSQTFLKNHQPSMFIHMISMDVLEGKFPGTHAIQSLFELILCINESSVNDFNVKNVINMAAFTLNNIMEKFPPCWLAANKQYRSLIQAKGKHLISSSNELLNTRTLFEDLLFCIENIIQAPAKQLEPQETEENDSMFNDSLFNDSQELKNFQQFEINNAQKYLFDNLPREQKIDRVFLALSLFIQLFETDLAMWTIRNLRNPNAKFFDSQKGPLIGMVLWSNGELNQVNYFIKNILKLYVNYISIDFRREHTHILGRLVNIIYNIFHLRDFRFDKSISRIIRIEYPQPVDKQNYFCDAFTQIISDISGCNIEQWYKIIKTVENPTLKLYIINALLTKIDHKKVSLNPETIYSSLHELEKQFDDVVDKTNGQNNNIVERVKNAIGPAVNKYPYLQKIHRRAISELSFERHCELLLIALRAYMDIYHIDECKQHWQNHEQYKTKRQKQIQEFHDEINAMELNIADPFDLIVMQDLQKTSLDNRIQDIQNDNRHIYDLDVLNEINELQSSIEIDVHIKMLRNDAKFIDLITIEHPKIRSKFTNLFPN